MPDIDPTSVAIIFVALGLGGLTKGLTGFGLPLVSVPVMASIIGLDRALAIMVLPAVASNFWLLWVQRAHLSSARRYIPLVLASIPGIAFGGYLLTHIDRRWLLGALAGWIVIYVIGVVRRHPSETPREFPLWRTIAVGLVGGTSQGATGISTPIVGTYLDSLALKPGAYVFASAAIYQVFWFSTGASLGAFGLFSTERAIESLLALLPVAIFVPFGAWLSGRISPEGFSKLVRALLVLIAARLVYLAIGA